MKLDRITTNPERVNGQPCIRNMRLTVRRVLKLPRFTRLVTNCAANTPKSRMKIFGKHCFMQHRLLMIALYP